MKMELIDNNYQEIISKKIDRMSYGTIISSCDFKQIAKNNTINKILARIEEKGKIKKIFQGIYYKPEYNKLIKEYSEPQIDEIAHALAKKNNWKIAPSGNSALNRLHLSTQVTNAYYYVSSGPYKEYDINGIKIYFKRVKQNEILNFHDITILLIQAIKTLGKENITDKEINILKKELSNKDKKLILKESEKTTSWIYEIIKDICIEK